MLKADSAPKQPRPESLLSPTDFEFYVSQDKRVDDLQKAITKAKDEGNTETYRGLLEVMSHLIQSIDKKRSKMNKVSSSSLSSSSSSSLSSSLSSSSASSSAALPPSSSILPDQLTLARLQKRAFEYLVRGAVAPPGLLEAIDPSIYSSSISPMDSDSSSSSPLHAFSAAPIPKRDFRELLLDRDRRTQESMSVRLSELAYLPQSLPSIVRADAILEQKALQLAILKRHTMERVETYVPSTASLIDRVPLQIPPKSHFVSAEEKRKSLDSERMSKQRRFLEEVSSGHHRLVNRRHHIRTALMLCAKQAVEEVKRREEDKKKQAVKDEHARLQALKENNEAEYYRLLEDSKNQRLLELLKSTEQCLERIGSLMAQDRSRKEKDDGPRGSSSSSSSSMSEPERHVSADGIREAGKSAEEEALEMALEAASSDETKNKAGSVYGEYMKSRNKYYAVAHRFSEDVKEQPKLLGGGDPNLKLKPYQMAGLQWMVSLYNNKLNGILADEMGLGKTIQTLSLILYLYENKDNKGPHLLIVPLSVVRNWVEEFARWAPTMKLFVFYGRKDLKKDLHSTLARRDFNVVLTTYEHIINDKAQLKRLPWQYIIMDEGHRIKNANCVLVKALQEYNSKYRLLLTGTPLQNNLHELWALLHFLLPNVFDSSVNFETWFNSPFMTADKSDKVEMNEEETLLVISRLHQVLRPFLFRREKKDVEAQLPDKVEKVLRCELSALQRMFYNMIQDDNRTIDAEGNAKRVNNAMMHLRKVCAHPFLFMEPLEIFGSSVEDPKVELEWMIRASGKFELLDRMLTKLFASGHKVLIFSQFKIGLDLIGRMMDLRGHRYFRLDGDTKHEDRGEMVSQFNKDPSILAFILSTRAGGLGLNLQASDTVIIFDSDWNPTQDEQAKARSHRIGQTRECRVYTLVSCAPVEEGIFERANKKKDVDAKVIRAGQFNTRGTDADRRAMLEELVKQGLGAVRDDVQSDEELNQYLARSDAEFELFEKMDRDDAQVRGDRPRLMTHAEIPAHLVAIVEAPVVEKKAPEKDTENFGRGRRERKSAGAGWEQLSEKQFLQAVEMGMSPAEYKEWLSSQESSGHRRKRGRPSAAERQLRDGSGGASSSSAALDDSEANQQPTAEDLEDSESEEEEEAVSEEEVSDDERVRRDFKPSKRSRQAAPAQ